MQVDPTKAMATRVDSVVMTPIHGVFRVGGLSLDARGTYELSSSRKSSSYTIV